VTEKHGPVTTDVYFSSSWQVVEERQEQVMTLGLLQDQYVWSPVGTDTLVERDSNPDGSGHLTLRLYVQQDANGDVTALVNASGAVVERYAYDPYGSVTVLNPNTWATMAGSAFAWVYLHQGGRYDAATGLYNFRNRDESPTLGRWLQVDPIRLRGGDTNLYRDEGDRPTSAVDPTGLRPEDATPSIFKDIGRDGKVHDDLPDAKEINQLKDCKQILKDLETIRNSLRVRRQEQRKFPRNSGGWVGHEIRIQEEMIVERLLNGRAKKLNCFEADNPPGVPVPIAPKDKPPVQEPGARINEKVEVEKPDKRIGELPKPKNVGTGELIVGGALIVIGVIFWWTGAGELAVAAGVAIIVSTPNSAQAGQGSGSGSGPGNGKPWFPPDPGLLPPTGPRSLRPVPGQELPDLPEK
jgi:RHS repeat-associated protein